MSDGYHSISSVFHSVALGDILQVSEGRQNGLQVKGDFDCPPEATTIYRAAELFMELNGIEAGLEIEVDKRIPVQAGLGGGSADAAGVLVALDRLFPGSGEGTGLAEMGARVGSDVPFFLFGGAAYVSGRGEKVESLQPRTGLGILLIKPAFGMSTARAYAALDSAREGRGWNTVSPHKIAAAPDPLSDTSTASQMLGRMPSSWTFENDFSALLFESFSEYGMLDAALRDAGAAFVSISGSGSCIYGVFDSLRAAMNAQGLLEERTASAPGLKTLSGMALRAIKPLETSIVLR